MVPVVVHYPSNDQDTTEWCYEYEDKKLTRLLACNGGAQQVGSLATLPQKSLNNFCATLNQMQHYV